METIRLLLVEDDRSQAVLVRKHFERADAASITVHHADSLAAAMDALTDHEFDVVVFDLSLPDATGLQGIKKLRREMPTTPVVVLTGTGDPWLALAALKLGAQDFLVKGQMDSRSLVRAVVYAVTRHRTLAAARESETNLRSVLENASDGLAVVDGGGTVVYANPSARMLIGGGVREIEQALFGLRLIEGETSELVVVDSGGSERVFEVRVTEVRWQRRYARLLALRDLSERRRNQRLHERLVETDRLAVVGLLALGCAREINYPAKAVAAEMGELSGGLQRLRALFTKLRELAAASSDVTVARGTERLAGRQQFETQTELLDELLGRNWEHVTRITDVVHDFLMLARTDDPTSELIDVNELLVDASHTLRDGLRDGARLTTRAGDLPPVLGNRARLSLVLTSLLYGLLEGGGVGGRRCGQLRIVSRKRGEEVIIQLIGSGRRGQDKPQPQRKALAMTAAAGGDSPAAWPGTFFARAAVADMGGTVIHRGDRDQIMFEISLPASKAALPDLAD